MTIDVRTPDSPGWWMNRLSRMLVDPERVARLKKLDDWYQGDPPLPDGAQQWKRSFQAFQKQSRTNFAELVVEACRERLTPRGIRTSADGDDSGDDEAWRIWRRANMGLVEPEAHRLMLRFGESFVLVNPVDSEETGVPVVTAEDPRSVVAEQDPLRPWRTTAGLKIYRDAVAGFDLAYLYRRGRLDVATLPIRGDAAADSKPAPFTEQWTLDPDRSIDLPAGLMPLVRFRNHEGQAEFEKHLDLLSRINAEILRRMVIEQLQAFRQRAMEGLKTKDDEGKPIDYTGMFEADPGSLWAVPPDVKIWESQQVDTAPLLAAVRDDIRQLAAVTRTTVHTLDPGGENQSAEGAALSREGLVFKCWDRISLATPCWSQVMRAAFLWLGDEKRADLDGIDVIWESPEHLSLTERASAAAQAKAAGVPWRTILTKIMGLTPEEMARAESDREDDLLFAQRVAMLQASAAQAVQPQQQPAQASQQVEEPEGEPAVESAA